MPPHLAQGLQRPALALSTTTPLPLPPPHIPLSFDPDRLFVALEAVGLFVDNKDSLAFAPMPASSLGGQLRINSCNWVQLDDAVLLSRFNVTRASALLCGTNGGVVAAIDFPDMEQHRFPDWRQVDYNMKPTVGDLSVLPEKKRETPWLEVLLAWRISYPPFSFLSLVGLFKCHGCVVA